MIKKEKIIIVAIVLTLFATLVGLSYAFYTVNVNGNDSSSRNIVKSGNLEIVFSDGAAIDAQSMLPGDIVSKTFTVNNSGNRNIANYNVYFSKLYNTFTNNEMVYSMTCSSSISTCNGVSQTPLGTDYSSVIVSNALAVGETHTYTLYIEWLETSSVQDYNLNQMVGFIITVNETNEAMVGTLKGTNGSNSYTGEYYAYKSSITSITFEDEINIPSDAVSSWDVSSDGSSKVMSYIKSDGVSGYELYIQSEYIVYAPVNSSDLFYNFSKLTEINNIDLLDTSNATNMSGMFFGCSSLTSLDISNFNTSNVTNMASMFSGCSSLTSLDISNFNTSNVTNMSWMFGNCSSLTSLDISNFNTSKVTTMYAMFYECRAMTSVDLSSFNTSEVRIMTHMFFNCRLLQALDLSSFDISNVTEMNYMFMYNYALASLDIRNMTFTNVSSYSDMMWQIKNNATYIVKDIAAQTFINARLSDAGMSGNVTIA